MSGRVIAVPPRDPQAEPVCLLDREWAARRTERPDVFLSIVTSEVSTERGIEYCLPASPESWDRLEVFVREEGECCPFLGFEALEEAGQIKLQVIWPEWEASNG